MILYILSGGLTTEDRAIVVPGIVIDVESDDDVTGTIKHAVSTTTRGLAKGAEKQAARLAEIAAEKLLLDGLVGKSMDIPTRTIFVDDETAFVVDVRGSYKDPNRVCKD